MAKYPSAEGFPDGSRMSSPAVCRSITNLSLVSMEIHLDAAGGDLRAIGCSGSESSRSQWLSRHTTK